MNIFDALDSLCISFPKKNAEEEGVKLPWEAHYKVHEDFIAFSGHFPEYPLLPAMAEVTIGWHMVQKIVGKELLLAGVPSAKFTAQVFPDEYLLVRAGERQSGAGGLEWDIDMSKEDSLGERIRVATFRIAFREEWQ